MIGGYNKDELKARASEIVRETTKDSRICSPKQESNIPKFHISEIKFGKQLGRGQFSYVFDVKSVVLLEEKRTKETQFEITSQVAGPDFQQDRHFIANQGKNQDSRYALKTVMKNLKDPTAFVDAVKDLAIEAHILSVINHPNIIKMRAVSVSDPCEENFFILLDRLHYTLTERIVQWKESNKKIEGLYRLRDIRGEKKIILLKDRLFVALDIISALKYLHDNNIVYRDLKPENIGFDSKGDVKLIDFGLAKELNPKEELEGGLYKLSGNTGSLRYMAPEVAKKELYNTSVDVYSFAILLWEICALKKPFEDYNVQSHRELVVYGDERPLINPRWPGKLSNLMTLAWSSNILARPTSSEIMDVLHLEVIPSFTDRAFPKRRATIGWFTPCHFQIGVVEQENK